MIIKKPFLSGETIHIQFRITDRVTGVGFQPSTLSMSIYDVTPVPNGMLTTVYRLTGNVVGVPVTSAIVNTQDDVDVSGFVDSTGLVEIDLTPDDTTVPVPSIDVAHPYQRNILFTATWDSPEKTRKQIFTINIIPDRESAAA